MVPPRRPPVVVAAAPRRWRSLVDDGHVDDVGDGVEQRLLVHRGHDLLPALRRPLQPVVVGSWWLGWWLAVGGAPVSVVGGAPGRQRESGAPGNIQHLSAALKPSNTL